MALRLMGIVTVAGLISMGCVTDSAAVRDCSFFETPKLSIAYYIEGPVGIYQQYEYDFAGKMVFLGSNLKKYCFTLTPQAQEEVNKALSSSSLKESLEINDLLQYPKCSTPERLTWIVNGEKYNLKIHHLQGAAFDLMRVIEDECRKNVPLDGFISITSRSLKARNCDD